jgi:GTPase SAR1 family protein
MLKFKLEQHYACLNVQTMFDVLSKIKVWVKELKATLGNDVILFIVGNKSDLEKDRRVLQQDAQM